MDHGDRVILIAAQLPDMVVDGFDPLVYIRNAFAVLVCRKHSFLAFVHAFHISKLKYGAVIRDLIPSVTAR